MPPENETTRELAIQPDSAAAKEELAAIQEAIDGLESGEAGVLFEEFDRDFLARHNLIRCAI